MTYDLETIRAELLLELQSDGKISQNFGRTMIRACAHGLLEDAAIGRDAADEITRLRARVAELEAALERIANDCGTNLASKDEMLGEIAFARTVARIGLKGTDDDAR